ncbi:DrmB family protein [Clostridium butyricum]
MKEIKETIPLNNDSYNVRFSQAVTPFGVGSMIDFKDQTLMMAATDYWTVTVNEEIHDERLERLLNVDKFCLPPEKSEIQKVPFVRFPRWYFCPKCNRLRPIEEWEKDFVPRRGAKNEKMITPRCMECKLKLVPAGILVVCNSGHIDDFPWIEWVHKKHKSGSVCGNPQLQIKNNSSSLGLEGLIVKCSTCNATANLKGAFGENAFEKFKIGYKCTGNKPWSGEKEKCVEVPKSIQRGALNIYFSKVVSSIVIPPYSRDINMLVKGSNKYSTLLDQLEDTEYVELKGRSNIINSYAKKIADDIHQPETVVKIILDNIFTNDAGIEAETKEQYRIEEYKALTGDIPQECMNEKDFKIEIQKNISDYNIKGLNGVTLVKKMREVRALVGFSRINPVEADTMSGFDNRENNNGFISIRPKDKNWYPAYECRGEGIFIELDNEMIENWVNKNPDILKRIEILNERYNQREKKYGNRERNITPKFVLMHTLAHLLIKQLSFECGYDSASLSERIYCNTLKGTPEMSGILIYTSSGDSEGTLGGVVRQGKSDMLPRIFNEAVKKAAWCSSDPVCIESKGQGRDGLNLSACHACTLISETSCEEFNVLLDRVLVVGELENRKMGFFGDVLDY